MTASNNLDLPLLAHRLRCAQGGAWVRSVDVEKLPYEREAGETFSKFTYAGWEIYVIKRYGEGGGTLYTVNAWRKKDGRSDYLLDVYKPETANQWISRLAKIPIKREAQGGAWVRKGPQLPLERAKDIVDGDTELSRLVTRESRNWQDDSERLNNPEYVAWLKRNMAHIIEADPELKWEERWNKIPESWRTSDSAGYPAFYLVKDWDLMGHDNTEYVTCTKCFQKEAKERHWLPTAFEINYEDTDLVCENCNEWIPSAYGDDDDE
jgi:hypothetical protein